ncbi:MAG: hypothetical protein ACI9KE_001229 [Polyangiales bacterium]|jgi:hypothetical protein
MSRVASIGACLVCLLACGDAPPQSPLDDSADHSVQALGPALTHPSQSPPAAEPFPDMGPGEQVPLCDEVESSECGECAAGFHCAPAFCGGEACVPGHPCTNNADCPTGECVRPEGAPPSERGMCPSLDTCAETRECALGFRCELGSCVDRRIPCGFHSAGCPRGMSCSFMPMEGRPYCVAAQTPCETTGICEPGARCLDVDGDGQQECSLAGGCASNTECPPGFSCGVDPGTSQSACVVDGACRDGNCPSGLTCLDTGSGRSRCVRIGDCVRDADCPPRFVCGSIAATDPLRCLSFDERDESDTP